MTEIARKRRTWPWGLLAAALFIFIALAAWQYRPLNPTERQLVGTWQEIGSLESRLRYFPDRRFCSYAVYGKGEFDVGALGSWSCTDSSLIYRTEAGPVWSWSSPVWSLRRLFLSDTLNLRFDENGHIWIGPVELVQVPDESIPSSLLSRLPSVASGPVDPAAVKRP